MSRADAGARLGGVNVWSSAPAEVAAMLGAALGKELRERDGAPDGPHFSGRAGDLMLSVHPSKEPYAELALLVADLDHAIEVCAERGSRVVSGPAAEPYGRVAHMAGPGGLRVELVQAANTKS